MLCFLTSHFQTRCGLAALLFLEARERESPPSHKTTQSPDSPPGGPVVAEQAMACSGRNPWVRSTRLFISEKHRVSPPREGLCGEFKPQVGKRTRPARTEAGSGHTGANLAEVTGEAGKPFFVFCFSQAGNKTHRSLKPTHSSLLGRASRAPARRCRSAQKAGRSRLPARSARGGPHRGPSPLHPLCRKERSL